MTVYRIAKTKERATDLSGLGAFLFGGRWNSAGISMLYTSENSSLAYLEVLAHLSEFENPPLLYLSRIEIDGKAPVYELPEKSYTENWQTGESDESKSFGNKWAEDKLYLVLKVKSAINPNEYNVLLNPDFPKFSVMVKMISVAPLTIDARLRKTNF